MNTIAEFLKNMSAFEWCYDGGMILWAVAIFVQLNQTNRALKETSEKTEKSYRSTRGETKVDLEGNLNQGTSRVFDREKHEPVRNQFTDQTVKYVKWGNLISTLPLLGLLGTVLGLIPGLTAVKAQDFDTLYSALSTALSSTVVGLVASLVLKIYASVGPDAAVNRIRIRFEEIDRMYETAIGMGRIDKA